MELPPVQPDPIFFSPQRTQQQQQQQQQQQPQPQEQPTYNPPEQMQMSNGGGNSITDDTKPNPDIMLEKEPESCCAEYCQFICPCCYEPSSHRSNFCYTFAWLSCFDCGPVCGECCAACCVGCCAF
ncbi:hypothetical protein TWF694_001353 [Orbilia ellipsospora]|uniref:Cysteine-rich transmembrane CYSTM domain-containing protein n=1 Tax=Orbilia ellipsospora TaxID=2528407 RepID=A0AAV9XS53_9PEZI